MKPSLFLGLLLVLFSFDFIGSVVSSDGESYSITPLSPLNVSKQLIAVRRRAGLTHQEYLEYHVLQHGATSWNASAKPQIYIQDHTFDSVFGTKAGTVEPNYFGRDDITELFSNSNEQFEAMAKVTTTNGDGANFNDITSTFFMTTYETEIKTIKLNKSVSKCDAAAKRPNSYYNKPGSVVAFYWVKANNSDSTKVDNATFAQSVVSSFHTAIEKVGSGVVYGASTHIPTPESDSKMNVVIKLWLCDARKSVSSVRAAQKMIESDTNLKVDFESSFMIFAREVTLWDLNKGIQFDTDRLSRIVNEETKHY